MSKILKTLSPYAQVIDVAVEVASFFAAMIAALSGDFERAIFCMLVCIWFGRGSTVRALARQIREELDK